MLCCTCTVHVHFFNRPWRWYFCSSSLPRVVIHVHIRSTHKHKHKHKYKHKHTNQPIAYETLIRTTQTRPNKTSIQFEEFEGFDKLNDSMDGWMDTRALTIILITLSRQITGSYSPARFGSARIENWESRTVNWEPWIENWESWTKN